MNRLDQQVQSSNLTKTFRQIRNAVISPFPLHAELFIKHVTGGVEGNQLTAEDFSDKDLAFLVNAMKIKNRENMRWDSRPENYRGTTKSQVIENQNKDPMWPQVPSNYVHPVGSDLMSLYDYPHHIEKSFGHVRGNMGSDGSMTIKDRYEFNLKPNETKHAGSFDTTEGRALGAGRILDWAKRFGWAKPFDININLSEEDINRIGESPMTPELQIKKNQRDQEVQRVQDPLSIQKHKQIREEND